MKSLLFPCALSALVQTTTTQTLSQQADPNEFLLPHLTSDFQKENVPAQWAKGYPRQFHSEDASFQFNDPEPGDKFRATLIDRYAVIFNGSHAKFINWETNVTAAAIDLAGSNKTPLYDMVIRETSQGGYDLVMSSGYDESFGGYTILYRRIGPDLTPNGGPTQFPSGFLNDYRKIGKIVTPGGQIQGLPVQNSTTVTLKKNGTRILSSSFSDDGQYLATFSSDAVDLWNATSGEKIFRFPLEQPADARISPDHRYVAISKLGSGQVYIFSTINLTAEPEVLGAYADEYVSEFAWSPDSKRVAIGTGRKTQVWSIPGAELAQTWAADSGLDDANKDLTWLSNHILSFRIRYARYIYDFETNSKYWLTAGVKDHLWRFSNLGTFLTTKEDYIVTEDGDSVIRYWKI